MAQEEEIKVVTLIYQRLSLSRYDSMITQEDISEFIKTSKYTFDEIKDMPALDLYDAIIGQGVLFES